MVAPAKLVTAVISLQEGELSDLIPTEHMGQLNFANAASEVDTTEMTDAAHAIRVALEAQAD